MKIFILLTCILLSIACSAGLPEGSGDSKQEDQTIAASPAIPPDNRKNDSEATRKDSNTDKKPPSAECPDIEREGKTQIKSQSFKFNYKPFLNTCFVTFGSRDQMLDERDVPRGSTFHLYQNGKPVLDLPDAFDGQEGCWIEAVSFKDLNNDGFTDILIAGRCLAARDSYPANAFFVNTGRDFTTDPAANQNLEDFKKLSEIENFVRKNQKLFF